MIFRLFARHTEQLQLAIRSAVLRVHASLRELRFDGNSFGTFALCQVDRVPNDAESVDVAAISLPSRSSFRSPRVMVFLR